ncbi:hypothetical protein VTO42DRAFT_2629 [Malbranchea cinnamomea]
MRSRFPQTSCPRFVTFVKTDCFDGNNRTPGTDSCSCWAALEWCTWPCRQTARRPRPWRPSGPPSGWIRDQGCFGRAWVGNSDRLLDREEEIMSDEDICGGSQVTLLSLFP